MAAIDGLPPLRDVIQRHGLDARKALQPVTETLYKSLTPEQRERADVVLLLLSSSGGVEF